MKCPEIESQNIEKFVVAQKAAKTKVGVVVR